MKILIAAFAASFAMSAHAEPTAEIFVANGCDVETLAPVLSVDGETVLYWQNVDGGGCAAYPGNDVKLTILDRLRNQPKAEELAAK